MFTYIKLDYYLYSISREKPTSIISTVNFDFWDSNYCCSIRKLRSSYLFSDARNYFYFDTLLDLWRRVTFECCRTQIWISELKLKLKKKSCKIFEISSPNIPILMIFPRKIWSLRQVLVSFWRREEKFFAEKETSPGSSYQRFRMEEKECHSFIVSLLTNETFRSALISIHSSRKKVGMSSFLHFAPLFATWRLCSVLDPILE